MSRILTIASQTGGVGKTTTAWNLGYLLNRLGERVLLVDIDPQSGMTMASNVRKRTDRGLVHLLRGELPPEEVVVPSRKGGFAVVGSGAFDPEDTWFIEDAARDGSLATAIRRLSEAFSYTLVDAPAGVGSVSAAAMVAADAVLLVVRPKVLNLKTLPSFLKLVKHVRASHNPGLRLEGALLTMCSEGDRLESDMIGELGTVLPPEVLFRAVIPFDGKFEQASLQALPIALLADGRETARPYLELALEIKEREMLRGDGGRTDEYSEGLF